MSFWHRIKLVPKKYFYYGIYETSFSLAKIQILRNNFELISSSTVQPGIAAFTFGDEPANSGETVTATCTVIKGDYPIYIEWSLNGEPIFSDNPDITIGSTSKRVSVLTIDTVSAHHAGEYTCSASNQAGGTSYSASLVVNGIFYK